MFQSRESVRGEYSSTLVVTDRLGGCNAPFMEKLAPCCTGRFYQGLLTLAAWRTSLIRLDAMLRDGIHGGDGRPVAGRRFAALVDQGLRAMITWLLATTASSACLICVPRGDARIACQVSAQ
ncbi:hypothetical protein D3C80_634780 [compost metagenome]